MAGLYKKEVLIREVSSISVQGAKTWTINWITNTFQEATRNTTIQYDEAGDPIYPDQYGYIDYYFADVFDSRDGNIYRVFSTACAAKYDMTNLEYAILDNSKIALKVELPKIVNETLTISGNTAQLTHAPLDGTIIGDEVRVVVQETATQISYLSVDYTLNGKTLTILGDVSNEFSGKQVKVSYPYVV